MDGLTYRWPQTSPHPAPGRFHPCRRGRWDIPLRTLGSACCRPPLGRIHPGGRGYTGPGPQNWTRRCAPTPPAHPDRKKREITVQRPRFLSRLVSARPSPGSRASPPPDFGPAAAGRRSASWPSFHRCKETRLSGGEEADRRAQSEAAFLLPVVSHDGGGQHAREQPTKLSQGVEEGPVVCLHVGALPGNIRISRRGGGLSGADGLAAPRFTSFWRLY